ncbi:cell wall assembly regulator Smi1p [Diutina catenulata]
MGFLDEIKSFVHSLTTDDHYASFSSPYKNSGSISASNVVGARNSSATRLHEINNGSSASLVDGSRNGSRTNIVGYRPGLRSSSSAMNSTTDLPMSNLNASGQPPLPSVDSLWDRIEKWMEDEYPELEDCLEDGVTTADLNEFENDLGCGSLPTEFRQFYKRHDGQMRGGKPTGVLMGLTLMDLESIHEEHAVWCKVADRLEKQQFFARKQASEGTSKSAGEAAPHFTSNQRSVPTNAIKPVYYYRGWVPLFKDYYGNQVALDLAPGPSGTWGQMILFGRDFDTKLVVASSFQEFIFMFVQDLENGNFRVDSNEIREELGFLSSSRDDEYGVGDEDEEDGELSFWDRDGAEFGKGALKGGVSYIEIMKRRALKRHGLAENYTTSYISPSRKIIKKSSALTTPQPGSPITEESLLSTGILPKETLIGGAGSMSVSADDLKTGSSKKVTPPVSAAATARKPSIPQTKEPVPKEAPVSKEAPKETTPKEVKTEDKPTEEEVKKEELIAPEIEAPVAKIDEISADDAKIDDVKKEVADESDKKADEPTELADDKKSESAAEEPSTEQPASSPATEDLKDVAL